MNTEPDLIETRWWVAVNRSSVTASPFPLPPTLEVVPTPQLLFGFQTQEEQQKVFQFCLTAPIKEVHARIKAIQRDKNVLKIVPKGKPQPPSNQTHWLLGSR